MLLTQFPFSLYYVKSLHCTTERIPTKSLPADAHRRQQSPTFLNAPHTDLQVLPSMSDAPTPEVGGASGTLVSTATPGQVHGSY